jgi:hypothetical protein
MVVFLLGGETAKEVRMIRTRQPAKAFEKSITPQLTLFVDSKPNKSEKVPKLSNLSLNFFSIRLYAVAIPAGAGVDVAGTGVACVVQASGETPEPDSRMILSSMIVCKSASL